MKREGTALLRVRERELFDYFRAHSGRIISRNELSQHVWGFIMDPRSRTVDQTVATLRKKLGRGHQILTHHRDGYEYVPSHSTEFNEPANTISFARTRTHYEDENEILGCVH